MILKTLARGWDLGRKRDRDGFLLSAVCGRFIQTLLFGVRPLDLTTFAAVTIVLGIIAALSILGPAWRAARIDPAEALRNT